MKKSFIISIISVLAALGIGTSVVAFAVNKNSDGVIQTNRAVSSERVKIAREKYNSEKRTIHNKYADQIAYKYEEDIKSSDPYLSSAASGRAVTEASKLADKEMTINTINIVKRAGYLSDDYSYENDFNAENEKSYCDFIIAICKTFNNESFYMTTDEENLLLAELSFAYNGIKHSGTMRGEISKSTLKELEKTLTP